MIYNNYYLPLRNKYVSHPNYQNNTMDSILIYDSDYLFALCITDGLLEEMNEAQRKSTILAIANIKERILQGGEHTPNECK